MAFIIERKIKRWHSNDNFEYLLVTRRQLLNSSKQALLIKFEDVLVEPSNLRKFKMNLHTSKSICHYLAKLARYRPFNHIVIVSREFTGFRKILSRASEQLEQILNIPISVVVAKDELIIKEFRKLPFDFTMSLGNEDKWFRDLTKSLSAQFLHVSPFFALGKKSKP